MVQSKRQKIRRIFIFTSLILFPLSIYYFSPYLPVMAAGEGTVSGSLFVFMGLFLISIIFGRGFCGWLCPAGAVQEFASEVRTKKVRRKTAGIIKYVLWVPWLFLIIYTVLRAGGFSNADFFYQTDHGISISDISGYIIYYGVILILLIAVLLAGRRGGCHTLCWMAPFMVAGKRIGRLLALPQLHIKRIRNGCTQCGKCTAACLMSIDVMKELEKGTLADETDCILCGVCTDTCPQKSMGFGFNKKRV